MSALKDRLRADLTTAMKARDEVRSSTLRMVLTAITNAEVAGKEARELTDEDIIGVLTTEAKKRREAATAFADGGRAEMADKEDAEAAVIAEYLPEQMSAEEIEALVTATIAELGVAGDGMKAMGRVMGVLTPQTRGRADGGVVAAEVRRSARLTPAGRGGTKSRPETRRVTGLPGRARGLVTVAAQPPRPARSAGAAGRARRAATSCAAEQAHGGRHQDHPDERWRRAGSRRPSRSRAS